MITTVVFLEGIVTLSNVLYTLLSVRELMRNKSYESRKLKGNVDDQFSLKRFFSCINITDKLLA